MRLPWSKPKRAWTFCKKCGSQMMNSTYNVTAYFDRVTGEPMVEVKPIWVCSNYRLSIEFDPNRTYHDLIYAGENYGIPASEAKTE